MSAIDKISFLGTIYDISGNNRYVTPQMFGAKADGTTDDTAAIQYAISNYYNVCFPKGHYRITSAINITHNQIHIFGADNSNTRIKCDGCGGFVVNGREQVVIQNIKIYGVNNDGYPEYPGITIDGSTSFCLFTELMITGFADSGIKANSATLGHVTNITVRDCQINNCLHGIEMLGTGASQVNIIRIEDNKIGTVTCGALVCGNKIHFVGNDFDGCEYGIKVDSSTTEKDNDFRSVYSLSIESNYFDWISKSAIKIDAHWLTDDHCFVNGLTIIGNYFYAPASIMETTYPLIDMRSSQKVYSAHNTDGGYMITGLVFMGNTTSVPSSYLDDKVLLDGGDCLDATSIIILSQEGNLSSNNEYIIQNTGNAKVIHKFGKVSDIIKLYRYHLPTGASVTDTGVNLVSGNVFRFDIEQKGVAKTITIPVSSESDSSILSSIAMYGYLSDGTKESLGSQTFTSSNESVVFGYDYVTKNNTRFEKQYSSYEFVITIGTGASVSVGNPVYEYYAQ